MTERTEEELTELARQLYRGEIFTSAQIRQGEEQMVPMIFLPLSFATDEVIAMIERDKPHVIYGELKDALPRGISGYPCLPNCAFLSKAEWDTVYAKYEKIKAAMESI